MDAESEPAEPEETQLTPEEVEQGWHDKEGGPRIVPLSTTLQSGHGPLKELRLSEPSGFNYEKLGQPYKMLSGDKKALEGEDKMEIEINVKKLNRYIELSNDPQLGFGEARKLSLSDAKNAHGAMLDFFGR